MNIWQNKCRPYQMVIMLNAEMDPRYLETNQPRQRSNAFKCPMSTKLELNGDYTKHCNQLVAWNLLQFWSSKHQLRKERYHARTLFWQIYPPISLKWWCFHFRTRWKYDGEESHKRWKQLETAKWENILHQPEDICKNLCGPESATDLQWIINVMTHPISY